MTLPANAPDLYRALRTRLRDSGIESFDLETRRILETRAGLDFAAVISADSRSIPPEILGKIESDLNARLAGKPLSRIYGCREFWGMVFELGPETLDPRPDTETLIEAALAAFPADPPRRILDLGTGTGCILAALLKEWPHAQGVASDLSESALAVAVRNFTAHGLGGRVKAIHSDWGAKIQGGFDLVVSNPPYIAENEMQTLEPEVRNHDPILALQGGFDGLQAYRQIFSGLNRLLNPGARALLEIGFSQDRDVSRLAEESGFSVLSVHCDLAGRPRVVEIICGDK